MVSSDPVAGPPEFVRLLAHPLRWTLLTVLAGSDFRVRELVDRLGEPQNLVSYHLRLLRDGGLVRATRSSHDGRDTYYHLDLARCAELLATTGDALHPALRQDVTRPSTARGGRSSRPAAVLFVCTGNSARSPMAEALLRHYTAGVVTVTSAGTRPAAQVHPHAVRVLREEFGIDIGDHRPRHLDVVAGRRFELVITLCDRARESRFRLARDPRRVHWSIPDPATASGADRTTSSVFDDLAAELDTRIRYQLPVLTSTRA